MWQKFYEYLASINRIWHAVYRVHVTIKSIISSCIKDGNFFHSTFGGNANMTLQFFNISDHFFDLQTRAQKKWMPKHLLTMINGKMPFSCFVNNMKIVSLIFSPRHLLSLFSYSLSSSSILYCAIKFYKISPSI